jgi:hypothetical protein
LAVGLAGAAVGGLLADGEGACIGAVAGLAVGASLVPNVSRSFAGTALVVAAVAGLAWWLRSRSGRTRPVTARRTT